MQRKAQRHTNFDSENKNNDENGKFLNILIGYQKILFKTVEPLTTVLTDQVSLCG